MYVWCWSIVAATILPVLVQSPSRFFSLLDILILLLLKLFIIVHIFLLPKFGNITLDLVRVKPHTDPCVNNLSVQDLRECHI